MRKQITITLSLLLVFSFTIAQGPIIECPADLTVGYFDVDENYETYGDPTISNTTDYTISKTITVVENTCDDRYTDILYRVDDNENSGLFSTCTQRITILSAQLNEVVFPDSIVDIQIGDLEDTHPDFTGYPGPAPIQEGNTNILSNYSDQILSTGPGLKVVRTWAVFDWCTGDLS